MDLVLTKGDIINIEYEFMDKRGNFSLIVGSSSSDWLKIKRSIKFDTQSTSYNYCCSRRYFDIKVLNVKKIEAILSAEDLPYTKEYIATSENDKEIGYMQGNNGREGWEYGYFKRYILKLKYEMSMEENTLVIKFNILASEVDKKSLRDDVPFNERDIQKYFDSELTETFTISVPKEKISEFLT